MTSSVTVICRHLFPSILCATNSFDCHLTFDDGPNPVVTPLVLEILKHANARATFFVLGKRAEQHPQLIRDILDQGHAIGNHSYDHPLLLFRSREFVRAQVERTQGVIERISGYRTRLFRPPFGLFNPGALSMIQDMGYQFVLWSLNPADYSRRRTENIAHDLKTWATNGSIVLLHDSDLTTHTAGQILSSFFQDSTISRLSFEPIPA